MAPKPSPKAITGHMTPSKTPQSKSRLNFVSRPSHHVHPSSHPQTLGEALSAEHPIEVIGRIRDHPDRKDAQAVPPMKISVDGRSVRVRTDIGYRDFGLDGISTAEEEDLDQFYQRFVESRINGVRLGGKCTIMMYGPTGSGKSHTMFGSSKQPGIVYRALKDILGEGEEEIEGENRHFGLKCIVQVTVLEIYNEEIYDLLSSNAGGGLSLGWPRGNSSKVKLDVMGGKAKNATFISGTEAGKISREVAKVEKRRIVKSTLCNDRSSRSHCLIILDVPSVGGRLMLVDMAGSENIEQAGQTGFEAKMQTAKINQGNIALKRVVESIANGDSHVPFRDSKLTMLLQDSFEDDKAKILMILCASPDPKELHRTISTLEYGAKAKCIVRAAHTPPSKDKAFSEDAVLGSRIAAMDEFIAKLQMENKQKEKQWKEAQDELLKKEEEVAELKAKLEAVNGRGLMDEEEIINSKVNERTRLLKTELEKRLADCQERANKFMELGRKKMEEKILQQQEELEMLRSRLEEIESELCDGRPGSEHNTLNELNGNKLLKRLSEIYDEGVRVMEKSMEIDIDLDEQDINPTDCPVSHPEVVEDRPFTSTNWGVQVEEDDSYHLGYPEKVSLSTVFEESEEEIEDDGKEENVEEEVKEVITSKGKNLVTGTPGSVLNLKQAMNTYHRDFEPAESNQGTFRGSETDDGKDAAAARRTRIQNIFMLCGNHRELAQNFKTPPSNCHKTGSPASTLGEFTAESSLKEILQSQTSSQQDGMSSCISQCEDFVVKDNAATEKFATLEPLPLLTPIDELNLKEAQFSRRRNRFQAQDELKENQPFNDKVDDHQATEVYVKWEATKEKSGKFIAKLKVSSEACLSDLRKLIEPHLDNNDDSQDFIILMLGGDPTGAPVVKEKETTVPVSKLPLCHNQIGSRLACLRPKKKAVQSHLPLNPMENRLPVTLPSSTPNTILKLNTQLPQQFTQSDQNFSPSFMRGVKA
ncbi:kinesin-like protein KIN-10A [Nymphaea colorata]|nr:kinesin-like protein KIN-10A [Nymphaea colorata]